MEHYVSLHTSFRNQHDSSIHQLTSIHHERKQNHLARKETSRAPCGIRARGRVAETKAYNAAALVGSASEHGPVRLQAEPRTFSQKRRLRVPL